MMLAFLTYEFLWCIGAGGLESSTVTSDSISAWLAFKIGAISGIYHAPSSLSHNVSVYNKIESRIRIDIVGRRNETLETWVIYIHNYRTVCTIGEGCIKLAYDIAAAKDI
jgi:hypothetical protein